MKSDVHRPVDLRAFLICVVLSMIWGFQQTAITVSYTHLTLPTT